MSTVILIPFCKSIEKLATWTFKGVDEETALPNLMMSLESDIFHEVLMELYRKNISAVHIHDAIVVPDSEVEVCASQIEEVMREVYKARGLHPTFSVDTY